MADPNQPIASVARQRGSGRVSALFATPPKLGGNGRLQMLDQAGKPIGEPVFASLRSDGDFARLRARIDPRLAPGTYAAELTGDGGSERIEVVVDPQIALRVEPPMLVLEGAAGARFEVEIMVGNAGNVPAELPSVGAFGVFPKGGVENAFGRAYRADANDGLQVLARFVESLRSDYGGMIRLKVGSSGPIAPGGAQAVKLTVELPDNLESGRVYSGNWPVLNLNYGFRITVTGNSKASRKGAAA